MGIVKQMWLEEMERGYGRPDGHICSQCVDDEWLKQWVTDNATSKLCSFCESESQDKIAASFEEFVGQVMNGIRFGWNHPDNEGIMYVSAEGGYQASISDNSEVLWGLGLSENNAVIEALINNIEGNGWAERGYYSGTESDILSYGWDNFKDIIKHKSRFFFHSPTSDEHYYGPDIAPFVMLDAIADVIKNKLDEFELVRPISEGTDLVRLRIERESKHSTAAEVARPPRSRRSDQIG